MERQPIQNARNWRELGEPNMRTADGRFDFFRFIPVRASVAPVWLAVPAGCAAKVELKIDGELYFPPYAYNVRRVAQVEGPAQKRKNAAKRAARRAAA